MHVRYLLDTNMASYVIKGNVPNVRERLLKVPMAEVGISVVTEAELRYGIARRPDAARLRIAVEEFLLRVEVLPWDSEAAKHYAELRADLEKKGEPMGNLDIMIAAHALAAEVVLVTHDRGFRRVKELKIEDWTKL
ncbi:MAG: type II toxin-antitoxin system VapC family toxin [Terriglobales bacterium]